MTMTNPNQWRAGMKAPPAGIERERKHRTGEGERPDAGVVVLAYLTEQAERLRHADRGVRRDAEDSVHQLRVAARKLRCTLRTFGSIVDKEATGVVAAELKWLGARLAPARDAEVAMARLGEQVDALPPELVLGPVRQFLTRHFAREAESAATRAAETLASKRYEALLRSIEGLLADPPLTRKARRPARTGLRKSLRKAGRRLRRAEAAADGLEEGSELDAAMHEVRKKAKRARYAADAARPVSGQKLAGWRKDVKAVQSTLGEHQDTVVTRKALYRLGITSYRDGGNAFTFGLLHGRNAADAAEARRTFSRRWRKLREGRHPTWLR
jgi:CHAD domain-containing protein